MEKKPKIPDEAGENDSSKDILKLCKKIDKLHLVSGDILVCYVDKDTDNREMNYLNSLMTSVRDYFFKKNILIEGVIYLRQGEKLQNLDEKMMQQLGWVKKSSLLEEASE